MCAIQYIEISANVAQIATAVLAATAYGKFLCDRRKRRVALTNYLRDEKRNNSAIRQKSLLHLMAQLSMTEAEVLTAGFEAASAGEVTTRLKNDETGYAQKILFEYHGSEIP